MPTPLVLNGIVPVIPTPFSPGGAVDYEQLEQLIEFAVGAGACACCLPAYASEFYKLSEQEKIRVVETAAASAGARLPVIGQLNHPSPEIAAETARRLEEAGVAAVAAPAPRMFPIEEEDLLRYYEILLGGVSVPLIVQDYHPSGLTLSVDFLIRLHRLFPQFKYLKLEEPRMGVKLRRVLQETEGGVGVIEGWGGMYMLELVPAGVCAVMPGLALTDLLGQVFRQLRENRKRDACQVFQAVLPQIVYSLQNMELFHHAEKRLLAARGVLRHAGVRECTVGLTDDEIEHIDFLNCQILELLDRCELPRNPAAVRVDSA